MKLSTKGRYGVRALVDMAVYAKNEHISLYSIAQRQDVSENYLEQVFSTLRKAGIVRSVKGAQGGYILADLPENITIERVLRALEGDITIVDEDTGIKAADNSSISRLLKQHVWDRMTADINNLVNSITLGDMADDYRKKNGLAEEMYYI
jgi:Rrf2 family transcriptional regulator, cysteine metabolism repressor